MVIYEVTAKVEPELCDRYEAFMRKDHIPALINTGCFSSALFEKSDTGRYRILYIAESRSSLDMYLSQYASALRKDFYEHFSDGVELSREEWDVLERFA
jgi:hypothetical protein